MIGAVLAVLVLAAIIYVNTRPYEALISGATEDEVATVTAWLQEQGITNYKTDGAGTVSVPKGQAVNLKARLLQEQYSSSESSWQGYFDRVSALSTVQDRDNAWLITLQESLADTIREFDNVRDAVVYINPGEDNKYVLDANNRVEASASVRLTMQQGKLLTEGQATAIRYLIAKGVAGLNVDEVHIDDTSGNIYDPLPSSSTGEAIDSTALALQTEQW